MTDCQTAPTVYNSRLQAACHREDEAMASALAINIAKDAAFYNTHIRHMVYDGLASKTTFKGARVRLGDYALTYASSRVKGYRHDELLLFWMAERIQNWCADRTIRPSYGALMIAARELVEHFYAQREAIVRGPVVRGPFAADYRPR